MTEEIKQPRKVSYSQYALWANCPKQWKLTYHDKLKPNDPSIHLIFGVAMHEAIQQWLDLYYNHEKFKSEVFDIFSVLKDGLIKEATKRIVEVDGEKVFPCTKDDLKEFYLQGCEILRYLRERKADFFPKSGVRLVGCEIPLEVMLTPQLKFIGYIDIILETKKGEIIILDLKTSTKGWSDKYEKKDPKKLNQLLLYKKFYADQFKVDPDDIQVKFVILKRTLPEWSQWAKRVNEFEPPQGPSKVKAAFVSFAQFLTETFDTEGKVQVENLHATPSKDACKFCHWKLNKELCPEGYYKE
jgi:Holliday junction resolvase-like predicted endonuclease